MGVLVFCCCEEMLQPRQLLGKHLLGAGLQFQRHSPLTSWQWAWQHTCRHGTGELAEFYIQILRQQTDRVTLRLMKVFKTFYNKANLQEGHTYSSKAIPPNPFKPRDYAFKYMSLLGPFTFKPPQSVLRFQKHMPLPVCLSLPCAYGSDVNSQLLLKHHVFLPAAMRVMNSPFETPIQLFFSISCLGHGDLWQQKEIN